ncbi:tellurite resistance TerB family protein [Paracoccus sp. M683]|uniref:tellurite resistance TerB family protein n=1 Tax=Paracoccus sp. M683 TaxID=2594268 RepID=UPI00117F1F55|nr:tellurite resistance TerB family protein [Paracoccus sp. M683]TRW99108.1 tellurite resistance TerB family protein [Paracoccus sp. M683]
MSLMKTLARVAAGVMLAKGIGAVMKNAQGGGTRSTTTTSSRQTGGGILGDLLGNNTGNSGDRRSGSGGLSDMLGQVLGGGSAGAGSGRRYGGPNSTGAQGGLGGILDNLTNQARNSRGGSSSASGGLGGILDQLTGGSKTSTGTSRSGTSGTSTGGGLGDVLGAILGGAAGAGAADALSRKGSQSNNDASFGELFNDSLSSGNEPEVAPTPEQNAVAGLMLRAMIQAAKSDGKIDDAEKQRLLGELGELDDDERQFIREQMAMPVDAQALARDVPSGLEAQVYLMSLMAIDFDSRAEAEYLHALAQGLGLNQQTVNQIHEQVGVQNLYA